MRIDRLKIFLDSLGGGAWPFFVGGAICLVHSVVTRRHTHAHTVEGLIIDMKPNTR